MAVTSRSAFIRNLAKLLGLPDRTIWFELRVGRDEPVTIKCAFYPEPREFTDDGELVQLLGEYKLTEITPPKRIAQPVDANSPQILDDSAIADLIRHHVRRPQ